MTVIRLGYGRTGAGVIARRRLTSVLPPGEVTDHPGPCTLAVHGIQFLEDAPGATLDEGAACMTCWTHPLRRIRNPGASLRPSHLPPRSCASPRAVPGSWDWAHGVEPGWRDMGTWRRSIRGARGDGCPCPAPGEPQPGTRRHGPGCFLPGPGASDAGTLDLGRCSLCDRRAIGRCGTREPQAGNTADSGPHGQQSEGRYSVVHKPECGTRRTSASGFSARSGCGDHKVANER
jgi:hypothetical protein